MEIVNGELIVTYTDGTQDNLGNITTSDDTSDVQYLVFTILSDDTVSVKLNPSTRIV